MSSVLREKRAKVSGCIARLERQLDQYRADLTHIGIKPKRTYAKRTRYFGRGELSRLCRESACATGTC